MQRLLCFVIALLPAIIVISGCGPGPGPQVNVKPTSPPLLGSGAQTGSPSGFYVTANAGTAVLFFPAGSSGNVAPAQTLTLTNAAEAGIALDPYNGGLVLGTFSGAAFYSPQLTGPTSSFSSSISNVAAVAEDTNQQLYLAGNLPRGSGNLLAGPGIAIVPSGQSAPSATIQGYNTAFPYNVSPLFPCTNGVAVDVNANVYVTTTAASPQGCFDSIAVYNKGVTGNVAPTAAIYGSNTGLSGVGGIAIGPAGIYVTNENANTVTIYPLSGNGNTAPAATIGGIEYDAQHARRDFRR